MLQIIIFSFNRAMQLDTLLSSFIRNWEGPNYKIDIVYNYSTENFALGYEMLSQKFKNECIQLYKESADKDKYTFKEILNITNIVRLVRNSHLRLPKSNFRSLTIKLMEESNAENIMFLTDDSMFVNKIAFKQEVLDWINQSPKHRQFSLRLGKGLSALPSIISDNGTYCNWNLYDNRGNWGYPFSVDSHIYNKVYILDLFKRYIFKDPNTLEGNIVSSVIRNKTLEQGRSFSQIKMLTFPINIVQTCFDNVCQNVSVEMLNECYLKGETLEYKVENEYNAVKQYTKCLKFASKEGHRCISLHQNTVLPYKFESDSAPSILIAGDFCPKERLQNVIDENEWHNCFPNIKDITNITDLSIVNFESTVADTNDVPINKIGSNLKTTSTSIFVLRELGFNMLTLANNHTLDYGANALRRTINEAQLNGLDCVGAGANLQDAQKILYKDLKGVNFAFINVCEKEFSIATKNDAGCNPLDTISVAGFIKEAIRKAERIILIIHGGVEHYQLPTPRMKKQYHYFIDCGADVIINHHQHCYSGYEFYNGKPIVYGTGNFCFDSKSDSCLRHMTYNFGYMVRLKFYSNKIDLKTLPYEQCYSRPGTYLLQDRTIFDSKIEELSNIISDDNVLEAKFSSKAESMKDGSYHFFKPYTSRILMSLNCRGLIPDFLSKKKLRSIKAELNCQSHLDVLLENLSNE